MKITLQNLKITNFKGIKRFDIAPEGENISIAAANGVGKTTIYDAFLWLLFSKDSTGRTDSGKGSFKIHPLNDSNQIINGLTTTVEADLEIDGHIHTFKKSQIEKFVKKQLTGYTSKCYIDDVPKKISDYTAYIASLIPEEDFKLLTDVHFFNEKMTWKARREVLLDLTGDIASPKGFDALVAILNGRTMDEYKSCLAEQKKLLVKDRDEINPRIDELSNGLGDKPADLSEVESDRNLYQADITGLIALRTKLVKGEADRQTQIDHLNALKGKLIQYEADVRTSLKNTAPIIEKMNKINIGVEGCKNEVAKVRALLNMNQNLLPVVEKELIQRRASLKTVQDEYTKLAQSDSGDTCSLCNQKLPDSMMRDAGGRRQVELEAIGRRGTELANMVTACEKSISEQEATCMELQDKLDKAQILYKEATDYQAQELPRFTATKNEKQEPDFKTYPAWHEVTAEITAAEKLIGDPVSDQIAALDERKTALEASVKGINDTLAQSDRIKQDKTRIKELEAGEKRIGQQLTDIEKQIAEIGAYKAAESNLITTAVNSKFNHVKFKLFDTRLNESIEPCCEAMLNGVPYSDCSYGQKIVMGIDIINVLAIHHDLSVPLWIDNSESLTYPIEDNGQVIQLRAVVGCTELTIE